MARGRTVVVGALAVLAACSSSRDAGPIGRPTPPTEAAPETAATVDDTAAESTGPTESSEASTSSTSTTSTVAGTTTTAAASTVSGVAVAGSAGGVEPGAPPFTQTDPFAEAVRLADGTCVGWAESEGGSTAGLAVGAPVTILDVEANEELGRGTVTASRWEDMSAGGGQWNCLFDFTATVTGAPAEFRVRVGNLQPWLARPDPSAPTTFVASVNSDASIGLIPSCPPVPDPVATTTSSVAPTTTTTVAAGVAEGWNAVGQYWSNGVNALCSAGLPVTAIARPCRPPGTGSEYITAVVDSADSDVVYPNGSAVPLGTAVTVVVATGRLCG